MYGTMKETDKGIMFRHVKILFRNFRGEAGEFNEKGDRQFSIVLSPEQGDILKNEGYNVKVKPPKEEGDDPFVYVTVKVSYKLQAPSVWLISDGKRTALSEETVGLLDTADIEYCDLTIRGSHWTMRGKSGVSGYLRSLYAILAVDELEKEYREFDKQEDSDDDDIPFDQ